MIGRRALVAGLVFSPLVGCGRGREPSGPTPIVTPAEAVGELLAAERHDYGTAKLALDRLVDATLDQHGAALEMDRLTASAQELAGPRADDVRKLAAVRTVIYQSGSWNDHRPFAYDLADPYGQILRNKLLSVYLSTRLGNCVSMPVLFLILADRLGVNVALSSAPLHVFVKFTDLTGKTTNLEATSGALPARDQWYREKLPMTDLSVTNGVYLRVLSRKEGVALMATTVVEHLMEQARYQDAIDVADAILANSPRDAQTMVMRGSAFARLMDEEFHRPYPTPDLVPPHLHGRYRALDSANQQAFAQAEALGWTPTEIPS
jgi:regulator of sirC expression with transglutaminase-like and TPR domain